MKTGFYHDERCFWHGGGHYALTVPVGGAVQPPVAGGLPESPETKRRLVNLLQVSGLIDHLVTGTAPAADRAALERVHPAAYLDAFQAKSDAGGGELGLRTPFGPGGYDIAALSAGLVTRAVADVLSGAVDTAYALSRPPGHHCLPDWPNGFCLLNNIAVAIESARAAGLASRFAVVDWDVHHGNGTEAIFYDRADVLTISLHQENNYPLDTGAAADRGSGAGLGRNINIPLPPGAGHAAYLRAMDRIVLPALAGFRPDIIVVACGFDASGVDPLSRMLAGSQTFRAMTAALMGAAAELCGGRLALAHEGGYSEVHVPFCGLAVIEQLSGQATGIADPLRPRIDGQQPVADVAAFHDARIDALAEAFANLP
ncbi:MAG: class II histone deacetylase [Pseudomonadota bacterium]